MSEFSGRNSNLAIDQKEIYTGYRSVIASLSYERGIGLCLIHAHAIDHEDFLNYLRKLRGRNGRQPLALFMDQLQVHKAKEIRDEWAKLDIERIYNVSYSPELNPIEAGFSRVKALFNRERLNCLVNKTGFNFDRTIE